MTPRHPPAERAPSRPDSFEASAGWGGEPGSAVRPMRSGYTRVRYILESRLAVLELCPAGVNLSGELAPLPDPDAVDVYDAAPHTVPERTRVLAACPSCAREGDACGVCQGSGHVEAWVTVRISRKYQVQVSGEGAARERHPDVAKPADFDLTEWPNTLVHQAWYRAVPPQLSAALHPKLNPRHERVLWVLVQAFIG